ncbi:MAG: hypothetical protein WBR26_06035 [Candidatus Acidiferrum sp.]
MKVMASFYFGRGEAVNGARLGAGQEDFGTHGIEAVVTLDDGSHGCDKSVPHKQVSISFTLKKLVLKSA